MMTAVRELIIFAFLQVQRQRHLTKQYVIKQRIYGQIHTEKVKQYQVTFVLTPSASNTHSFIQGCIV